MMTRKLIAGLSLVLVLVLAVAFVAPGTVAAKSPDKSQEGGNNKILVTNLPAGATVTVAPFGGTSGTLTSATGGTIETFAHVGTPTAIYVNKGQGNVLIGVVQATAAWPDTVLDSAAPQAAFTLPNFGVASPIVPNQGTNMSQPGVMSQQGSSMSQPSIGQPSSNLNSQGSNMPQQSNPAQAINPGQQGSQPLTAANSPWGPGFISRGLASAAQFDQTYTVKAGDTLGAIARQFGTTVIDLASVNNLSSPYLLRVGETLKVPGTPLFNSSNSSMSNQGVAPQQNSGSSSSSQGTMPQQNQSSGTPSQNAPTNQGSSGSGTGY